MPKFTLEEAPEFPVLPIDSIIQVTCTDIQEKYVDGKDGKDGWSKLEFTFVIDSVPDSIAAECGSLVGSKIWGSTSAKFTTHADNKLRQWTTALLGMDLNEGFELDTDVLLNRKARAVVTQYTKKTGAAQHQVGGLLPLVQAASAPASTAPVIQEEQTPQQTLVSAVSSGGWDDEPPF